MVGFLQHTAILRRSVTRAPFQRSFFVSAATSAEKKEDKPQIRGTPYANLSVGVPKETRPLERRVAQTPS